MAKQWTLEETTLLERLYPDEQVTPTQMKEIFQCSWPTITGKAKRLCLRRPRSDQRDWMREEIALLERCYPNPNITLDEMEQYFGRSWQSIKGKARSLGLRRTLWNFQNWTVDEIALLEQYYSDIRISPVEMERIFHRNWSAIRAKATSLGVRRQDFNRYHVDYFENVLTERQAYWLGILASDGSIDDKNGHSNIVLSLNRKDRILVEGFRNDVAPGAPIYEARNNTCKVQITSRKMIDDLSKYNIIPNKTNTYTWPQLLPDELAMPFLLGYFDGDGSLSQYNQKNRKYWQWQLVGTQPFLSAAQEYIQFHAQVEIREPRRRHKDRSPYLYLIYASAQETIKRIDRALNASGLGLPRKRLPQ